jgi:predicted RNA-binding protein
VSVNGYVGEDGDISLRPYIHFDLFTGDMKLTDVGGVEFYVYNESDTVVETTLYLQVTENKVKTDAVYDKYYLAPKAWTKIEIDNVKVLGWRENRLNKVTGFGLKFANQLKDGVASTLTLYVDEISYKEA